MSTSTSIEQTNTVIDVWGSVHLQAELLPDITPYRSPRAVVPEQRKLGQPLRVEVTLLCGQHASFIHVPLENRRMVRTLSGDTTLAELLDETLRSFEPPSDGLYGELRIRSNRRAARRDGGARRTPTGRLDTVVLTTPVEWPEEWEGCMAGWGLRVSYLLGQGDVGYLRFDYSDEWCWKVRVVAAGASAHGPDIGPFMRITPLDYEDLDATDQIYEDEPELGREGIHVPNPHQSQP